MRKWINVLSLFDWMSCWQIALDRIWIKVNKYYASEIKKHAIQVTQDNYPNTIQLWDVRDIKWADLPKIDLLIWWSPCQDLSIANKDRKWLEWDKSSLFWEYLRILKEVKPKYFFLENVKMEDEWYGIISRELWIYPVNINSSLVSAQLRNRYYWTNIWPYETNLLWERISSIPQPKDKWIMLKDIIENGFVDRDKARTLLESESRPLKSQDKMCKRYFDTWFTTLIMKDKKTYLRVKEATNIWFVDIADGDSVDLSYPTSKTRRGRKMWDKSNCLLRNNEYFVFSDGDLRYFTQTELERIQTVPDWYTKKLSRNKAACLLWDWWTVDVISHIFNYLPYEKTNI